MSEFKVIETQEQFDQAIASRLRRDRESYQKQFEADLKEKGWKSAEEIAALTESLNTQITTLQNAAAETEKTLAEKEQLIADGEKYRTDLAKTRIAIAAGLKLDYVDRVRGNNEEEWKKDAELLAKDFAAAHLPPPLGSPEPIITNSDPDAVAKRKFEEWMKAALDQ